MHPYTHFVIESAANESSGRVETRLQHGADVLAFAKNKLRPNSELLVACLGNGTDYGNLIVEIDALGEASLRALAHSGFAVGKISKEQALQALEYWLPAQERSAGHPWRNRDRASSPAAPDLLTRASASRRSAAQRERHGSVVCGLLQSPN